MPAYILAEIDVTDAEQYGKYVAATPAVIDQYGGRFVVRGGAVEILEGSPGSSGRTVLIEFPSAEQARAFWHSPEYAKAKALRQGAARFTARLLDGL